MLLTSDQIALLRHLAETQRVTYRTMPNRYRELESAGMCRITSAGGSEFQTEITDAGRRALEKADRLGTETMGPESLNASNDE